MYSILQINTKLNYSPYYNKVIFQVIVIVLQDILENIARRFVHQDFMAINVKTNANVKTVPYVIRLLVRCIILKFQ